jgi:hypothetical protein
MPALLLIRGILFTILAPRTVFFILPAFIDPGAGWRTGTPLLRCPPDRGWASIYLLSWASFFAPGARPLRFSDRRRAAENCGRWPLSFFAQSHVSGRPHRGFRPRARCRILDRGIEVRFSFSYFTS